MTKTRAIAVLGLMMSIILGSTVFFRVVEGWSWIDSYFFTIVTLSTVGYGNLVPVTALGKIGTTVLIFAGIGVFALAIQQFAAFALRKREDHSEQLFVQLRRPDGEDDAEDLSANLDTKPDRKEP